MCVPAVIECTEVTLFDAPPRPLLYELPLSRRNCGAKWTEDGREGEPADRAMPFGLVWWSAGLLSVGELREAGRYARFSVVPVKDELGMLLWSCPCPGLSSGGKNLRSLRRAGGVSEGPLAEGGGVMSGVSEPLGGSEDERGLRRGALLGGWGSRAAKLIGCDRRRLMRKPTRKMMAIIAKLEQIPIAALLPSVRPIVVLGTAPSPDAVELSSELRDVAAAVGEEEEAAVCIADGLLLDSEVWALDSPESK